jgi:Bacterial protein of unknown function (DUF882)
MNSLRCALPVLRFRYIAKSGLVRSSILRNEIRYCGVTTLATAFALLASPAMAQGFIEFLRGGGANAYAPSDEGKTTLQAPLSIVPVNPRAGDTNARGSRAGQKRQPVATPVPTGNPLEEDEDGDVVFEHENPKRVRVALPVPRPGAVERPAAEVAPVGTARWSATNDQLPPGVNLPGATVAAPAAPRLASLPNTQSTPRWTITDAPQVRPPGLRESETPVAQMPGVFAPPEANFDCLPVGLKQVLVDTAKHFGHVAILNAKRARGTGARASYHYQCRAVDFRVRGVPVTTVYAYLRNHPNVGGRKIYPFGFFHVDDGPVRSW